jgi:hypothetical protein
MRAVATLLTLTAVCTFSAVGDAPKLPQPSPSSATKPEELQKRLEEVLAAWDKKMQETTALEARLEVKERDWPFKPEWRHRSGDLRYLKLGSGDALEHWASIEYQADNELPWERLVWNSEAIYFVAAPKREISVLPIIKPDPNAGKSSVKTKPRAEPDTPKSSPNAGTSTTKSKPDDDPGSAKPRPDAETRTAKLKSDQPSGWWSGWRDLSRKTLETLVLYGLTEELRAHFDVQFSHTAEHPNGEDKYYVYLLLTPKTDQYRLDAQRAELVLRKDMKLPRRLWIEPTTRSQVIYDVLSIDTNVKLRPEDFDAPEVPPGWKMVDFFPAPEWNKR